MFDSVHIVTGATRHAMTRRLVVRGIAAGGLAAGAGIARFGQTKADQATTLSSDQIREMARRFYENYHLGDIDVGPELIHPTAVFHLPVGDVGTVESDMIINDLVSALEDFDWRVEDTLVDGDRAAVRWVMSGTHTGPLPDAPPTGNAILLTGISILRFEEDKIAEGWIEEDLLGFLQQLEVLPPL